jgi:hypothetical protein
MRRSIDQIIAIYKRSLARYEAEGRQEMVEIQKRLINYLESQKHKEAGAK